MYVIRNKQNKEYLRNCKYSKHVCFQGTNDINEARLFKNKQSASCAWTWATYRSSYYNMSELLEVEIKLIEDEPLENS